MLKTKIVCTLGPSTDNVSTLKNMLHAGMSVARFNFSHGTHAEHKQRIDLVRSAAASIGKKVALMLDTKGPEIRLGTFYNRTARLTAGGKFVLTARDLPGDSFICTVSHKTLYKDVKPGNTILLADGLIKLNVDTVEGGDIVTTVQNDGEIGDRKRVAVPGVQLGLPPLSEADLADLAFGIQEGMDYIAASFIQTAGDVLAIRQIIEEAGASIGIIAKIENALGVQNTDEILAVADGIMVARGDLGVEVPAEEVPLIQKELIKKCNAAGKPVITATQMLETMLVNPRPTRAEVSDIANAVLDGTDAIMLSGETASGKYPVDAVQVMASVAKKTETSMENNPYGFHCTTVEQSTVEAVCSAAVQVVNTINANAIVTITKYGNTAQRMSKLRPRAPIVAITPYGKVARRMQLFWGVRPVVSKELTKTDMSFQMALDAAIGAGEIDYGNVIVTVKTVPDTDTGSAVMMRVHAVADVIAKGTGIGKQIVYGKVRKARNSEEIKSLGAHDILCVSEVDEEIAAAARIAKAIICEEGGLSSPAVILSLHYGIPVVVGASGIMTKIQDSLDITVDTHSGIIYKGKVSLGR